MRDNQEHEHEQAKQLQGDAHKKPLLHRSKLSSPSLRGSKRHAGVNRPGVPLYASLGQMLIGRQVVDKGQREPAKAFGVLPVTPCSIEGVVSPYEINPVGRGLALMGF